MRASRDTVYLEIAQTIAGRSTCGRRHVGCVLTNKHGHILATGYNGVPRGTPHCNEHTPCPGIAHPSGEGLDKCFAVHAEQNALLQCGNVEDIDTCYSTTMPCIHCIKLLMNTSCWRIIFLEEYSNPDGKALWEASGRQLIKSWRQYDISDHRLGV